jgi:hypothetical protein
MGARDGRTIPALLGQVLRQRGQPARVRNLAQIGHVSTQEVVALALELKGGTRPAAVVFYNGVNDVLAALQGGRAGWPQNASNRHREFNLLDRPGPLLRAFVVASVESSSASRLADSAARRLGLKPAPRAATPFNDAAAAQVLASYQANLALLDALAEHDEFRVLVCWQPVLFTKNTMTDYEQEKAAQYDWLREPLRLVGSRLGQIEQPASSRVRFLDLSRSLDDEPGLIYVDFCHTTEAPNRRIAERIADAVAPALERKGDKP